MATPHFSQKHIHELCSAAISARLSRTALLSSLDRRFVASLPIASTAHDQILGDLEELNSVGALSDGSVPLRAWLQNAVHLTGPRVESAVFEAALEELDAKLSTAARGPEPRATPAQVRSANQSGVRGAPTWKTPASSRDVVQVYVSAASADKRFVQTLERHLAPLATRGAIQIWHRGMVRGGEVTEVVAGAKLREADLVLLLVSADYLADPVSIEESERAMELLASKGTRVVPVLARASLWQLSSFRRLTAFPRSGLPLASAPRPDDAFGELASHVAELVADLRTRNELPPSSEDDPFRGIGRGTESPNALVGSPNVREGKDIGAVFARNAPPDDTYVEPEQLPRIRRALRELGRGLVVEGPSQIGKSTAVRSALGGAAALWINLEGRSAEKEVRRVLLDEGKIEGHVVIDNAQKLHHHPALLNELARFVRWLADQRPARCKVTFIGISDVARRLVATQRDLSGRFDLVEMHSQKVEKIRELISRGEQAANVRFLHKAEIAGAARGSFHLAQELSYRCVVAEDEALETVQKGPAREIHVLPDDEQVRGRLKEDLSLSFDAPVFGLATADRDTATPGACLALLWLLSVSPDGRVVLSLAEERYPHLTASFAWVAGGGLEGFLTTPSNAEIASLVTLSAGALSAADPRFLYYLGAQDFKDLGARAGIEVIKPQDSVSEDLEILPRATQASVAVSGLLDHAPFAWWHPSAPKLREILASVYATNDVVLVLAKTAGVRTGQLRLDAGAESLWNSLLESATNQGRLRALIDAVLADKAIAGLHRRIRELIEPRGPAAPNTRSAAQ